MFERARFEADAQPAEPGLVALRCVMLMIGFTPGVSSDPI